MKQRLAHLDILKGLLILFLPIHHFSNVTRKLEFTSPYEWIVTRWQFVFVLFFMSTFFFISGYCSNFNKPNNKFILSQFYHLIIPYLVFTLFDLSLSYVVNGDFSGNAIHHSPYTAYWFLNALFASKIIHFCLLKSTKSTGITLFFSFALLITGVFLNNYRPAYNFLAFYNSLVAVFFVSAGYAYRQYENLLSKFERMCLPIYVVLLFLYVILYLKYDIRIYFTAYIRISLLQIPLFIALSICGTIAAIYLSKVFGRNKVIEYYGKNSLIVYVTHFWVLFCIVRVLYPYISPCTYPSYIVFLVATFILEYVICYLLCALFSRKPFSYAIGKYQM